MPAGRPSKYKPEFCETIVECAMQGQWEAEWASACDVVVSTLHDWRTMFPEFGEAFARARQESEVAFNRKFRDAMEDGTGHAPLYKWTMSAVFGKTEKTEVTNTMQGPNGGPIQTEQSIKVDFGSRTDND